MEKNEEGRQREDQERAEKEVKGKEVDKGNKEGVVNGRIRKMTQGAGTWVRITADFNSLTRGSV